jgi:hypothetical protein
VSDPGSTNSTAWSRGWRPGTRFERLRASQSYAPLLVLIGATIVFLFAAPSGSWALSVNVILGSIMLAVAIRATGLGTVRPALVLLATGVVVAVGQLFADERTVTGVVWFVDVGFVAATAVVIAVGVIDQREINRKSISGAVCIYLLLGIVYTFAYGALATLGSGDFFAQGTDGTSADRVYFSYVTLATLGYGDYTAAGSVGRAFSISEALLGQLYLVTVVALLVGRLGQRKERAEL